MIERLEYASCYAYSPRGTSALAARSRQLCYRIKAAEADAFTLSARRVREYYDHGRFGRFFGDEVTLVPVPGRAPLAPGAESRTEKICVAFLQCALGRESQALLERVRPVVKSAFAAPGERPTAAEHLDTLGLRPAFPAPKRILLVDDVVTRGATLLAAATRLRTTFPDASILAFALVRTESYDELRAIRDPCEGVIELNAVGATQRRP